MILMIVVFLVLIWLAGASISAILGTAAIFLLAPIVGAMGVLAYAAWAWFGLCRESRKLAAEDERRSAQRG